MPLHYVLRSPVHNNRFNVHLKCPITVHFISLIPSRSTSVFSSSLLTTSKLPLFNVLTFHVPILTLSFSILSLSTVLFVAPFLIYVLPFGFRASTSSSLHLFVTVGYPSPVVIYKSSNLGTLIYI